MNLPSQLIIQLDSGDIGHISFDKGERDMKGERRGHDNSEDSEEKRQVFLLVSNLGKLLDLSVPWFPQL